MLISDQRWMGCDVFAVIVTFYPDTESVVKLVKILASQVSGICIVDNGSQEAVIEYLRTLVSPNVQLVELKENLGVAKAHNIGIEKAEKSGATHVILFDQDSLPDANMVFSLLEAERKLLNQGVNVASVGPLFNDIQGGVHYPFVRHNLFRTVSITKPEQENICFVDYLITSGCLIRLVVIRCVGGMCDGLFIDSVDIEWGYRAKSHGYYNVGVFDAVMDHEMGGDRIRIFGRKTSFSMCVPLRLYYQYRNTLILFRMPWIPVSWRIYKGWKLLIKILIYSLFVDNRMKSVKMIFFGLMHGLAGKVGKLDETF